MDDGNGIKHSKLRKFKQKFFTSMLALHNLQFKRFLKFFLVKASLVFYPFASICKENETTVVELRQNLTTKQTKKPSLKKLMLLVTSPKPSFILSVSPFPIM